MFSHIQLGIHDLSGMTAFYNAVLSELGMIRMPNEQDGGPEGAGWQYPGQRWPQFFIQFPFDGKPASVGNGTQVSFAAPSQTKVDAAWRQALLHGGSDEGAPGLRLQYAPDYYSAYCRDPEGNKLCFVHAEGLPLAHHQ